MDIDNLLKEMVSKCAPLSHISKEAVNEGHFAFKEAKAQIDKALLEARKEQIMQDSLTLALDTDMDESSIIEWRNDRLQELELTKLLEKK